MHDADSITLSNGALRFSALAQAEGPSVLLLNWLDRYTAQPGALGDGGSNS